MANKESAASVPSKPGPAQHYRDTRFTSRVLILPDGRQLSVAQGLVSAAPDDVVALDYLSKHPDLQAQE